MNGLFPIQIFVCIFVVGITLYTHIDKQNALTELRMAIPALTKEVNEIQKRNIALRYQMDQFESPDHLMEQMRKPEFGHLKYPSLTDVIVIPKENVNEEG